MNLLNTKTVNCSDVPAPSRAAAVERIARVRPAAYARARNHIDGAVTGLSPYLTHGVVTLREVLAELPGGAGLTVDHKLIFELGWREFFRHVWTNAGDGILQSLHPGPLPDSSYSTVMPDDVRRGCTGVPVIDCAVRVLYTTGTLHNHARMWLASYLVHVRRVHWRAGADWLVAHLLDGDLASNHLSWQWVAGTGSHKPYLFNADNVAKYAPAAWHSYGSVVDRSYEELERIARGAPIPVARPAASRIGSGAEHEAFAEPPLHSVAPPGLALHGPGAGAAEACAGRVVWLVHPWALRAPPPDLPKDAVVVGVYPREHFGMWPWPAARWQWVDAAMAEVAQQRWLVDAVELTDVLRHAACVRSVADPHVNRWLSALARLDAVPSLFPPVQRACSSFSQWWRFATRGLSNAGELL